MKNTLIAMNVGFVNPETGKADETQFDVQNRQEAKILFKDFCRDNHWTQIPKILYIEVA